jgi:hypothetical protein
MKNIFIGHNAGADLLDPKDVIIIGDNIKSLDRKQKNVLFIGDKMAIGETLFGIKINVKDVIARYVVKGKKLYGMSVGESN